MIWRWFAYSASPSPHFPHSPILNTTKSSNFHHLNFSPPRHYSLFTLLLVYISGSSAFMGTTVTPSKWADHSHGILDPLLLKALQWQENSRRWSPSTCSVSPFNLSLTYHLRAIPEYLQFPDNLQFQDSVFPCAIPPAGMPSRAPYPPNLRKILFILQDPTQRAPVW